MSPASVVRKCIINRDTSGSSDIDIGNPLQIDLRTDSFGDEISILLKEFDDSRTDGSETDESYGYSFSCLHTSRLNYCLSRPTSENDARFYINCP